MQSVARETAAQLAERAEAFCRHYLPKGQKNGNYWIVGNVYGDKGKSLPIPLRTNTYRTAGNWRDYESGEHGDLLNLLVSVTGLDMKSALAEARRFLGSPEVVNAPCSNKTEPDKSSDLKLAGRKMFRRAGTFKGTLGQEYLNERGITRYGDALRFQANAGYRDDMDTYRKGPALMAAITDNAGKITGCNRILIDPSTKRALSIQVPKRTVGELYNNAIRFPGTEKLDNLIVGEGMENTLSVGTAFPELSLASCLTATHMQFFTPAKHIKRIWIACDNDKAGEAGALGLRRRLEKAGLEVFDLVPERNDFNDDLVAVGPEQLRRMLISQMREQLPIAA